MRYLFIFAILSFTVFAEEEKYAVEGEGWKAWTNLEAVILAGNEKESTRLCSGRMKEGFRLHGMQSISAEVKGMKPVFIREFQNKGTNQLYLVVNVEGSTRTLMFTKKGKEWLFDDQNNNNYKSPEEALNELTIMQIQSKMRLIATSVSVYFSNDQRTTFPVFTDMGIMKGTLKYKDPESEQECRISMIKDVLYEAQSNLIMAVTEKPLGELHYALFEDFTIDTITVDQYKKHLHLPGFGVGKKAGEKNEAHLTKLNELLQGLGAKDFKARKVARLELVKEGRSIVPFLKKQSNHPDLEVKISVKEIIQEIEEKFSATRPKILNR